MMRSPESQRRAHMAAMEKEAAFRAHVNEHDWETIPLDSPVYLGATRRRCKTCGLEEDFNAHRTAGFRHVYTMPGTHTTAFPCPPCRSQEAHS